MKWHIDTQLRTPEQQDSDLLFPGIDGGFRSTSVLLKPFAEVAREVGLTKRITPRALRRTFNDLARAAQVQDVVTRSISGHLTEGMQRHYSTVSGDEQRQALARVIDLTRAAADPQPRTGGGPAGGGRWPASRRRWTASRQQWTACRGRWTAEARSWLRRARFSRQFGGRSRD